MYDTKEAKTTVNAISWKIVRNRHFRLSLTSRWLGDGGFILSCWCWWCGLRASVFVNTQPCIGRKTQCNKFCRGVSLRLIWKQVYWKNCIHVIFIFIDCLPVLLCGDFSSMTGAPSVALGSDQSDHQNILLEYFMATTAWKTRLLVLNTKGIPILAVCFNIHIYYRNCVFLFMSKTMSRK